MGSDQARSRSPRRPNIVIPPNSPFRVGRVQRQIKRAFIASLGSPLTTSDLMRRAYPRGWDHSESWRYTEVRLAASRYAVRIGRSTRRGRPWLWALRDMAATQNK
jgi:hypothetical protein